MGWVKSPAIRWLTYPFDAFAYLKSHGLDALLQMGNAQLWCSARRPWTWTIIA